MPTTDEEVARLKAEEKARWARLEKFGRPYPMIGDDLRLEPSAAEMAARLQAIVDDCRVRIPSTRIPNHGR
jgi:hypothetical protein